MTGLERLYEKSWNLKMDFPGLEKSWILGNITEVMEKSWNFIFLSKYFLLFEKLETFFLSSLIAFFFRPQIHFQSIVNGTPESISFYNS